MSWQLEFNPEHMRLPGPAWQAEDNDDQEHRNDFAQSAARRTPGEASNTATNSNSSLCIITADDLRFVGRYVGCHEITNSLQKGALRLPASLRSNLPLGETSAVGLCHLQTSATF